MKAVYLEDIDFPLLVLLWSIGWVGCGSMAGCVSHLSETFPFSQPLVDVSGGYW